MMKHLKKHEIGNDLLKLLFPFLCEWHQNFFAFLQLPKVKNIALSAIWTIKVEKGMDPRNNRQNENVRIN